MAIASMVLGIIALINSITGIFTGSIAASPVIAILAIIFGAISNSKVKTPQATAGIVTGIISLCWALVFVLACASCAVATIPLWFL